MGEKWLENKQSPRISWTQAFFKPFLPQTIKNDKFSAYPFLTFFSTRVLETRLGGLKAACLYWSCPIQILSKCWGWSNLVFILPFTHCSVLCTFYNPQVWWPCSHFIALVTGESDKGRINEWKMEIWWQYGWLIAIFIEKIKRKKIYVVLPDL